MAEQQQGSNANTVELTHGNIEAMKVKFLGSIAQQLTVLNRNMVQLQIVLAEVLKEPLVVETEEDSEQPPGS